MSDKIGNADHQEVGDRLNNRAENSHQPFRRGVRAVQWFRSTKALQKFSQVHARVHNHFIQKRAISSCSKPTNRDARPRWLSGAPLRSRSSPREGVSRHAGTSHHYIDNAAVDIR
jgi:hypothetical protein